MTEKLIILSTVYIVWCLGYPDKNHWQNVIGYVAALVGIYGYEIFKRQF